MIGISGMPGNSCLIASKRALHSTTGIETHRDKLWNRPCEDMCSCDYALENVARQGRGPCY